MYAEFEDMSSMIDEKDDHREAESWWVMEAFELIHYRVMIHSSSSAQLLEQRAQHAPEAQGTTVARRTG